MFRFDEVQKKGQRVPPYIYPVVLFEEKNAPDSFLKVMILKSLK